MFLSMFFNVLKHILVDAVTVTNWTEQNMIVPSMTGVIPMWNITDEVAKIVNWIDSSLDYLNKSQITLLSERSIV